MELNNVISEYAIEYMGELYFSSYGGNSFYRYNRSENESYKIGPVIKHPTREIVMSRLYKTIFPMEKKIYLFPWTGDSNVNIYNLDTEELSCIDISMYDSGQIEKVEYKICDCFAYGKYLYAIGLNYPAVLRIDTESDKVECIIDFRNEKNHGNWSLFLGYGVKNGSVAYIPMVDESAFIQLNLESGETNKICIDGCFSGFTNMILVPNGDFYLLERWTNRIVHVGSNGKVISIHDVPGCPKKEIDNASYFDCLICEGNGFYLFPVKANHIYYFDFDKNEFEICCEFEEIMDREYKNNPNKNIFSQESKIFPISKYLITKIMSKQFSKYR